MQTRAKQERIIETVRQGLEGDAAVEFLHASGYGATPVAIARHLRALGGRGHIQRLLAEGLGNEDILDMCLASESAAPRPTTPPRQADLFPDQHPVFSMSSGDAGVDDEMPLYETAKMTLHLPSDLYGAIRMAARAEHKTRNDLVVEILTSALSRMPEPLR